MLFRSLVCAGGAAFCELEGRLACITLCASGLRHAPWSTPRGRCSRRISDAISRPFFACRLSDLAAILVAAPDFPSGLRIIDVRRCRARDGFLEGADEEIAANECLDPDGMHQQERSSVLWNLIQEIEPLDVSRVGQGVSIDSKDAMKRTISGMLGLLPSDRFDVTVEATPGALEKLLISSVMTGYTLRNAEYRVCLHRSLELAVVGCEMELGQELDSQKVVLAENQQEATQLNSGNVEVSDRWSLDATVLRHNDDNPPLTAELERYVNQLKSKLSTASKELEAFKRKNAAFGMSSMDGEEKNDLLDYLRSLDTEKVSELSQSSSLEVEEMVKQVVSRCLAAISIANCPLTIGDMKFDQFRGLSDYEDANSQHTIVATRDYLARLLFWCMLFGHHLKGLEYRLELSHTLRLCGDDVAWYKEERSSNIV